MGKRAVRNQLAEGVSAFLLSVKLIGKYSPVILKHLPIPLFHGFLRCKALGSTQSKETFCMAFQTDLDI